MRKFAIIILIILAALGFAVSKTTLFAPKGEVIKPSSKTSNWIPYQDKKYNYSFKYSPDFGILKDREDWQSIVMPKGFDYMRDVKAQLDGKYVYLEFQYRAISNAQVPDALSFVRSSMQKDTLSKIEDIIVDGKKGVRIIPEGRISGSSKWQDETVVIQVNQGESLWIQAQFRNMPFDKQLMDDFLSTIKFS